MHAVFVTFSSSATDGEARTVLQQHATAMVDAPALVDVTWIADGSLLGGFFVFADDVAADDYLASDVFESVRADPTLFAFEVRRFAVVGDVAAIASRGSRQRSAEDR
jgi:hypothetical protein